jgi:uncharacterized protein involved in outer membrane biogenesis
MRPPLTVPAGARTQDECMARSVRIPLLIAGALALVVATCAALGFAVERGSLRAPLLRLVSARANHPLRVDGDVEVEVFSRRPRVVARKVVVGNPAWMPKGELARIDELTVSFAPTLLHPLRLYGVELRGAVLRPRRDADGKANWRREERGRAGGGGLPPLRRLVLENVTVHLRDAPRHLDFDGEIATLAPGADGSFRVTATGELNGRPMRGSLRGAALAGVRRDAPYNFSFDQRSSGARMRGSGSVLEPFNFARLDIDFAAEGADLRDLFYLIGVRMPDTGAFTAKGRLLRRGTRIEFRDLEGQSGQSDIRGSYVSEGGGARRRFTADLQSTRMRMTDLGPRAAGRQKPRAGPTRMLSEARIPLEGLRLRDGSVSYQAAELVAGPLSLQRFATQVDIESGVLEAGTITASTRNGGRLEGKLRFDAQDERPAGNVALRFEDMAFGELFRGKSAAPPVEAPLSGSLKFAGEGRSLHELAAGADGEFAAALSAGTMRASLAEAIGFDLRSLGLRLSKPDETLPLRCGVARFEAKDGKLVAKHLVLDTEPVVVHGEGGIDLESEALDLRFQGRPKQMRLRLRSALVVKGVLAEPSLRVEEGRAVAQAGAAVALGALLAPAAAVVALVDPGRAEDQDCAAFNAAIAP